MSPVASRRPRRTLPAAAVIGLAVIAAACTPNEGPSTPTVAPTLAVARPAAVFAGRVATVTRT